MKLISILSLAIFLAYCSGQEVNLSTPENATQNSKQPSINRLLRRASKQNRKSRSSRRIPRKENSETKVYDGRLQYGES